MVSKADSIPSFLAAKYESQEMRRLLENKVTDTDENIPVGLSTKIHYKDSTIFPSWILNSPEWMNTQLDTSGNAISEVIKIPANNRSQEQISTLIHWLMSVWKTAYTMGFKRCGSMIKEFKYLVHKPGEDIVREGERGFKFYIIISGTCSIRKAGLGVVGNLGFGKTFGEIALTQEKNLRTATVTAETTVELLTLHKTNFDFFVRDLQAIERRENLHLLTECTLFKSWSKTRIEKMVNVCARKVCEPGEYIFHQGDPPGDFYLVVEGSVKIIKEFEIIRMNRWPSGPRQWTEMKHRIIKPVQVALLERGHFFGEMAIVKNINRSGSAIAVGRTVLVQLDQKEFRHHVLSGGNAAFNSFAAESLLSSIEAIAGKFSGDDDALVASQIAANEEPVQEKRKLKKVNSFNRIPSSSETRKRDTLAKGQLDDKMRSSSAHSPSPGRRTAEAKGSESVSKSKSSGGDQKGMPMKASHSSAALLGTGAGSGQGSGGTLTFSLPVPTPLQLLEEKLKSAQRRLVQQQQGAPQRSESQREDDTFQELEVDPALAIPEHRDIENQVIVRRNSSIRLSEVYHAYCSNLLVKTTNSGVSNAGPEVLERPSSPPSRKEAFPSPGKVSPNQSLKQIFQLSGTTTGTRTVGGPSQHGQAKTQNAAQRAASAPQKRTNVIEEGRNKTMTLMGESLQSTATVIERPSTASLVPINKRLGISDNNWENLLDYTVSSNKLHYDYSRPGTSRRSRPTTATATAAATANSPQKLTINAVDMMAPTRISTTTDSKILNKSILSFRDAMEA